MTWAPDYLTVDELSDYVRVGDDVDDVEIDRAIAAASRAIDDAAGRQFGKVAAPEARVYRARWDTDLCVWVAPIDDLATVTGSLLDGVVLDAAALYPRNAVAKGKVWTRLVVATSAYALDDDEITVTGAWGWPAVPAAVTMACALQASRFLARRDSPFGVAGSPAQGSELRLLSRLDPDVAVSLRGYIRPRPAA